MTLTVGLTMAFVLVALLVWSACWYVVQLVRLSLPTREQAPTAAKLP